jgi:hypothetical protein
VSTTDAIRRHFAVFALYAALTVALTWPLAAHLDTFLADRGDPVLNCWIIDWGCHALTHAPLHLFAAPIFHPAKLPLAYSEHMTGIDLVVLPLHVFGAPAIAVYNIALLLGFAFAGFGAFVLARMLVASDVAAFVAGVFTAFVSFKFDHLSHLQVIWTGWLPLMLAALVAYWRRGRPRDALLLAAAFVMNGLTNVYWLAFGGTALVLTIAFLAAFGERRDAAFGRRLAVALVIACAVLLPFLIPYQIVSAMYRMWRTSLDSRTGSATLFDWLMPFEGNRWYGWVGVQRAHPERRLFLGVMPIVLALCAFFRGPHAAPPRGRTRASAPPAKPLDAAIAVFTIAAIFVARRHQADVPLTIAIALALVRFAPQLRTIIHNSRFTLEEWCAALWVLVGMVGAFGEHAFLHPFLFRIVPIFRATRTPARWVVILHTGLAVFIAIGVNELLKRTRRRHAVAAIIVALTILELIPNRIAWAEEPNQQAPVYRWLKRSRPEVIVELPVSFDENEAAYLLAQTYHRVPTMNGVSGFDPPVHRRLIEYSTSGAYDDAFYDLLASNGCRVLIVHEALLGDHASALHAWLVREVTRGRLQPLERFGEDDVYAIGGVTELLNG